MKIERIIILMVDEWPTYIFFRNKGSVVNQANAGKNIMGTAKPGKSSRNCMSRGNVIEMGTIIKADCAL